MPIAAGTAAAAITAGAQLLGSGANTYFQGRMNKRTREFAREMYGRQRNDALSFWRMQNEYNSPSSQMARFKAAGLNPNLIYGRGSSGNAGAINVPNRPEWNPKALTPGNAVSAGISGIASIYNLRAKDAQINNLGAQNTLLKQQAANVAADTASKGIQTARGKFDLNLAKELRKTSLDAARENLRKTEITNKVQLQENERRAALTSKSLKEAAVRIIKTRSDTDRNRAEIKRIQQDTRLKHLDEKLRKLGIYPHDPAWMRLLIQLVGKSKPHSIKEYKPETIKKWESGLF